MCKNQKYVNQVQSSVPLQWIDTLGWPLCFQVLPTHCFMLLLLLRRQIWFWVAWLKLSKGCTICCCQAFNAGHCKACVIMTGGRTGTLKIIKIWKDNRKIFDYCCHWLHWWTDDVSFKNTAQGKRKATGGSCHTGREGNCPRKVIRARLVRGNYAH